jgi:hypothetical protein
MKFIAPKRQAHKLQEDSAQRRGGASKAYPDPVRGGIQAVVRAASAQKKKLIFSALEESKLLAQLR